MRKQISYVGNSFVCQIDLPTKRNPIVMKKDCNPVVLDIDERDLRVLRALYSSGVRVNDVEIDESIPVKAVAPVVEEVKPVEVPEPIQEMVNQLSPEQVAAVSMLVDALNESAESAPEAPKTECKYNYKRLKRKTLVEIKDIAKEEGVDFNENEDEKDPIIKAILDKYGVPME